MILVRKVQKQHTYTMEEQIKLFRLQKWNKKNMSLAYVAIKILFIYLEVKAKRISYPPVKDTI
jgi:hypothetical protein